MMDDLLVPEGYREDMIRVLKYGVAHSIPTVPDPLAELLLKWCSDEERKIDVFEGRAEPNEEEKQAVGEMFAEETLEN